MTPLTMHTSPLRRYLQGRRLRVDWLAEQSGIKPRRLYNLSAGYGRWTRDEATRVTAALAAEAARTDTDALYHHLFDGVDVRLEPVASSQ